MSGQSRPIHGLRQAYAKRRLSPPVGTAARWIVFSLTVTAVATWLVLIALLASRVSYGSESLRALEAVTGGRDEAFVAGSTWGTWLNGPFTLWTLYGDLYFLLGWLLLRAYAIFQQPTEQTAVVVLRCVSLSSYVVFGTGLYFWAKRRAGPIAAAVVLLLAASLTASDEFAMRATACQTDMLNLAVTTLALILIIESLRTPTLRSTVAVGVAVGAVMAIKLSAVFIALLAGAALLLWCACEEIGNIHQTRSASRHAALRLVGVLLAGSLLIVAAVVVLSGRGYELGRLPIPPAWPRALGAAVYPLALATVFIAVYLVSRAAESGESGPTTRSAVFVSRGVIMMCAAGIAFAALSPNALFALRFLDTLGFQAGAIQTGGVTSGGGLAAWLDVLMGGALLWLVPLSTLFAVFVAAACVKSPSERLDRDGIIQFLVLAWEAIAAVTIILLVGKPRERFLYPVFPAFLVTATLGVMALAFPDAPWRHPRTPTTRQVRLVVLVAAVLLPAAFAVASVHANNARDYSNFAERPGYRVGTWLDARFPADISIMQDDGAYIPQRYDNVTLLPYGDPYAALTDTQPQIMLVNLEFKTEAEALQRHETHPALMIEAGIVQDFYNQLLSGELGYTVVKRFRATPASAGFVILLLDRPASQGRP